LTATERETLLRGPSGRYTSLQRKLIELSHLHVRLLRRVPKKGWIAKARPHRKRSSEPVAKLAHQ
jgi:hypothetical protein